MRSLLFVAIFGALCAWFVLYYLDTPVPEEIPEKWKIKLIDASMRTYAHIMKVLTSIGYTTYFSSKDRLIADWFILAQTTGVPWQMSLTSDPKLKITDTEIDGVRVMIYEPKESLQSNDRAVLIYFHGGGWSLLSVDCYDPLMRKIARDSGVVIISVQYRLSPQHPYPTPLNDCLTVVNYVINNAENLGLDDQRIAIGGDSAGGNMAAVIGLRLPDRIAKQFLLVPVLQFANFNTSSFIENTKYFHGSVNSPIAVIFIINYLGLSPMYLHDFLANNHTSKEFKNSEHFKHIDHNIWMVKEYVRDRNLREHISLEKDFGNEELYSLITDRLVDSNLSPLMAPDHMLKNLQEVYVMTAGYDFIRDDGVMYAERLKAVRVKTKHMHYLDGFHHALMFPHGPLKLDVAVRIIEDIVTELKETL